MRCEWEGWWGCGARHRALGRTCMHARTGTHVHTHKHPHVHMHPHTRAHAHTRTLPSPTLLRDKWPFLQPGGGGHALTPLSIASQAVVLESRAPWSLPLDREKEQGPGGLQGEVQPGHRVGEGLWCLGPPERPVSTWGQECLFLRQAWSGAPCQHSTLGLLPQHGEGEVEGGHPGALCTVAGRDTSHTVQSWRPGQVTCAPSPGVLPSVLVHAPGNPRAPARGESA